MSFSYNDSYIKAGRPMVETVLNMLPSAIGVAISPIPIVAVILMLMSRRARANGAAFAIGWIVALCVVLSVVLWLAGAGRLTTGGEPSTTSLVISFVLGIFVLFLALKNWSKRPKKGQTPATPKWMAAIDKFSAGKSFMVGFLLAGVNPKNLALAVAGAVTVVSAGLGFGEELTLLLLFVLVASVTVIIPLLYLLLAQKNAVKFLKAAKVWLIQNNAVIMAVLLGVIGLKITLTAATGLW